MVERVRQSHESFTQELVQSFAAKAIGHVQSVRQSQ